MDTHHSIKNKRDQIEKLERSQSAKALREVNKTFHKGYYQKPIPWTLVACILGVLFIGGCIVGKTAHAKEYTNTEIVNAIFLAEGGKAATYKYGIRSVKYRNEAEARKICFNTVRNNRKRFKAYGYKQHSSFIQFLGSRYCPTKGRNLTQSEKRLNGNWVRNVEMFLAKGVR